jgi:hypothetical protein
LIPRRNDKATHGRGRRAALLLEVVVALTILVAAMGILGAQLVGGLRITAQADEQARASQLADRILSLLSLDPAILQKFLEDPRQKGDFGEEEMPGWFWEAVIEPSGVEGLGRIQIDILYQDDARDRKNREGARIVKTVHLLKAAPKGIDLAADFGFTQEQIDQLAGNIPIPDFDPSNLNPQALAQLITPETLMDLLPAMLPLIQQLGGGALPEGVSPEDLLGMLSGGGLPGGGGGGGSGDGGGPNPLLDLIEQQIGNQLSPEDRQRLEDALNNGGGSPGAGTPRGDSPRPRGGRSGRTAEDGA